MHLLTRWETGSREGLDILSADKNTWRPLLHYKPGSAPGSLPSSCHSRTCLLPKSSSSTPFLSLPSLFLHLPSPRKLLFPPGNILFPHTINLSLMNTWETLSPSRSMLWTCQTTLAVRKHSCCQMWSFLARNWTWWTVHGRGRGMGRTFSKNVVGIAFMIYFSAILLLLYKCAIDFWCWFFTLQLY